MSLNTTVPTNINDTYAVPSLPIENISNKEDKANKGVANGYAPLDATSKVPSANLPVIDVSGQISTHNSATTSVHGIANTANLVLTNDARLADTRDPKAHTHTKSNITDFTHTHAISDVTNLQTSLDTKFQTNVSVQDVTINNALVPYVIPSARLSAFRISLETEANSGAVRLPTTANVGDKVFILIDYLGFTQGSGKGVEVQTWQFVGMGGPPSFQWVRFRSWQASTANQGYFNQKVCFEYNGTTWETALDWTAFRSPTPVLIGAVATSDPRLADTRTPTAHKSSHATGGTDALTPADIGAQPSGSYAPSTGISPSAITGTAVVTNDLRLSDPRTPTAHKSTHATGGADALTPSDIGASPTSHSHDTATSGSAGFMSASDKAKLDGVASGAGVSTNADWTAVSGGAQILNKPNSFTPTAHKSSHATGGADALTPADIGAQPSGSYALATHSHAIADVTDLQATLNGKQASGSYAPSTGISPSAITGTAVVTNDARLSDNRSPTAHKSTHATGGSDALTPADIGALPQPSLSTISPWASQITTTGRNQRITLTEAQTDVGEYWQDTYKLRLPIGAGVSVGDVIQLVPNFTPYINEDSLWTRTTLVTELKTVYKKQITGCSVSALNQIYVASANDSNTFYGATSNSWRLRYGYNTGSHISYATEGIPLIENFSNGNWTYWGFAYAGYVQQSSVGLNGTFSDDIGPTTQADLVLATFPAGSARLFQKPFTFRYAQNGWVLVSIDGHRHQIADVTGLQTAFAPASGISPSAITGTAVVTNDSRLSDNRTPTSHTHGNITNDGKILIPYGGIVSATGLDSGSFSNGTFSIIQGGGTGGVITVNSGIITVTSAGTGYADGLAIKAGGSRYILVTTPTQSSTVANLPLITTTSGVVTIGSFGTTANSFCQGDDSRLSDPRTPTAHTHTIADVTDLQTSLDAKQSSGASTGGNARGTNAVDLQLSRAAVTQVASGNFSVIGGGANNTAREGYTFVGGGRGNSAQGSIGADVYCSVVGGDANSAQASYASIGGGLSNSAISDSAFVAGGRQARADRVGMFAHSAGQFSANGDAQSGRFVLRCRTTTDSAVEMALNGSTTYLTIPSGKVIFCNIKIVGTRSDGSAVATYERQYAVKNVAGTSSEIYAPRTIGTDNASGTSLILTTVNAGDYISIRPVGISSEIWRWVAVVDAVEVAYGT